VRVERITDWPTRASFTTQATVRPIVGVAVGPSSDEGIVRIGDFRLQAGRVMPLPPATYYVTATHDIPFDAPSAFPATAILELLLFDDPSELACEVARANGRYSATGAVVNAAGYTRALTIPFAGRRQCRLSGRINGATDLGYQIVGRLFSPGQAAVRERTLLTVAAVVGVRDFVEVLGGLDNAEVYHELALELRGSGVDTANVEAEAIGEIGCR